MKQQRDSDMEFVHRAFSTLAQPEPSAELKRRVAQIPLTHPQQSYRWWWPFQSRWQPATVMVAAAALGVVVGLATVGATADSRSARASDRSGRGIPPNPTEQAKLVERAPDQEVQKQGPDNATPHAADAELEGLLALAATGDWETGSDEMALLLSGDELSAAANGDGESL